MFIGTTRYLQFLIDNDFIKVEELTKESKYRLELLLYDWKLKIGHEALMMRLSFLISTTDDFSKISNKYGYLYAVLRNANKKLETIYNEMDSRKEKRVVSVPAWLNMDLTPKPLSEEYILERDKFMNNLKLNHIKISIFDEEYGTTELCYDNEDDVYREINLGVIWNDSFIYDISENKVSGMSIIKDYEKTL